jgi:hypothetical protein
MDTRFGTWSVRSLYRAGSTNALQSESAKYEIDADDYAFFCGYRNANH